VAKAFQQQSIRNAGQISMQINRQLSRGQRLAAGLCFAEGPRWRDGALWFSDMHAQRVMRLAADGSLHAVVSVAQDPSGLGWLPDGQLLIVSMRDRKLLRWNGSTLAEHADLSDLAAYPCNDMVVDARGRAYVGNFGFDKWAGATPCGASLICVEPDGRARVVADDLAFPNGMVITPDGRTLVVAESYGSRLTAFSVEDNGDLTGRRVWAEVPDGDVPDGICLDADGCIWSALPRSRACIRQREGGEVTHRLELDQRAFACMLGGPKGDTLHVLTADTSDPDTCRAEARGRIEAFAAPSPRAGLP
jgi:sugar lactone lactonase YvrE